LLGRSRRLAEVPNPLALAPRQPVLELTCRHSADTLPLALEHRLISLRAVPDAAEADFSVIAPGPWLIEHVPWTEAQHRISAVNADAEIAAHLEVARQSACLVAERQTWRAGTAITFVPQVFRGDLYHLVARFTPGEVADANRA
jgi:GntR family histidine utilization transcriptional repressor